jgi:hypothetical protein
MIGSLIVLVVYILILGLVLWLLHYVVNAMPMFEPFRQVANIIITVIGVIALIFILLSIVGDTGLRLPRF